MYPDERVLAELRATANAPLFGINSVMVGSGIVGGTLMANDQSSRQRRGRGCPSLERRPALERQSTGAAARSADSSIGAS